MLTRLFACAVLCASAVFVGCGYETQLDYTHDRAVEACRDMADTLAGLIRECSTVDAYRPAYDAFVQAAADGDCRNVVALRDEAALYQDCLPAIHSLGCYQLDPATIDDRLPDSCKGQLLH
jgi:hypothetical protein